MTGGGGNVGIGFAVPINMARRVMEQIVKHGHVKRGGIGVSIKDLTPVVGATQTAGTMEGAVIAMLTADPRRSRRNPKRRCRCCCRRSADPQRRASSQQAGPHPCGRARAINGETGRCGPHRIGGRPLPANTPNDLYQPRTTRAGRNRCALLTTIHTDSCGCCRGEVHSSLAPRRFRALYSARPRHGLLGSNWLQ